MRWRHEENQGKEGSGKSLLSAVGTDKVLRKIRFTDLKFVSFQSLERIFIKFSFANTIHLVNIMGGGAIYI